MAGGIPIIKGLFYLLFALSGACAPLAKVTWRGPLQLPPARAAAPEPQQESASVAGLGRRTEADAAISQCVDSAEEAFRILQKAPGDPAALKQYDYAVSCIFSVFRQDKRPPASPVLLTGGRRLEWRRDARPFWNPEDYDFYPVGELVLGGSVFQKPVRRAGLGAPVVAVRKRPYPEFRKIYLGSPNVYYGVTGVLRFEGKRCVLAMEDPLATEQVQAGGQTFPLAGDFTTALAMLLERDRPDKLGLVRMLRPGKYDHTTMLYRLQPFDPTRIPVVFVHGLDSTPATWMPMFTALLEDEVLRRKYQFWFFSYPSGYPFAYSAALLRKELDGIAAVYPHKPMVMVGHSMGGLLTRLMVTDSKTALWHAMFRSAPADTPMKPSTRQFIADCLLFQPRKDVARVVFCSTPQRGSDIAAGWLGRLGSKLVHLPMNLMEVGTDVLSGNVLADTAQGLRRMPNSVDSLSQNAPFLLALDKLPPNPKVPFHQILGDRGKGDSPDSSDGFVPYWSAWLEGSESSLIVPSNHSSHAHPQAIAEIARILHKHLRTAAGRN